MGIVESAVEWWDVAVVNPSVLVDDTFNPFVLVSDVISISTAVLVGQRPQKTGQENLPKS